MKWREEYLAKDLVVQIYICWFEHIDIVKE